MPERSAVPAQQDGIKKKSKWFGKIETRDDALRVIKETSLAFFFVAALQAAFGVFITIYSNGEYSWIFVDVVLYVLLAFWLRYGKSHVAAVGLLIVSGIAMLMTIAAQLQIISGGRNIVVAAIVLYCAVKAVDATFKLRGRFSAPQS